MSMSREFWPFIGALVVLVVLAISVIIYKKNSDDFKKRQHKKIVAERMTVAKKRKEQMMARKAIRNAMAVAKPRLSPAAAKMRETMKARAKNFEKQVIQNSRRRMNTENFRRKEKMRMQPLSTTEEARAELRTMIPGSQSATALAGGNGHVFTNQHISPTYGGVKKFSGHGASAGDPIRGDIVIQGRGVFPGQAPQHSTLQGKKGLMHL